MSITNLQQARQMYATGQRVAKTLNVKGQPHMLAYITPGEAQTLENLGGQKTMTRGGIPAYPPGMGDPNYDGSGKGTYSGSGGNQSTARERGIERNQTQRTTTKPTTRTGPTNIHGDGGGTTPYTYIGGKKYDVTPTTRNERDRATLKQQIMNQTVRGGNRIDKFGNTKKSPFRQGGGLGSLLMGAIGMLMGIPGLGLLTSGIGNLKSGLGDAFGNFNRKMRGVNKDGTTRTQAQYEQAMYDKRQQNRVTKLLEAKNRGYNQIGFGDFTKKTMDFTEGQQAKLDALMAAGYGPTTLDANNPAFQNDLGNPDMMNLNDVQSIVAASQMPQGMDLAGARRAMTQPTTYTNTPFEGARTVDTYRGVDPYKMNYLNRDLPTSYRSESLLDEQPQEDGIMGIDVGYPSNDLMAKVSNQDLARYSQQGDLTRATDYETAMDTIYQGSQMTPYEFDQLQKGNITQPGTYIG
mgnify:CR=1 FL=1